MGSVYSRSPAEPDEIVALEQAVHLVNGMPTNNLIETDADLNRQLDQIDHIQQRFLAILRREETRAEVTGLDGPELEYTASVVHRCPLPGSGIMPCCGRTPFEARGERMTTDDSFVTCSRRLSRDEIESDQA